MNMCSILKLCIICVLCIATTFSIPVEKRATQQQFDRNNFKAPDNFDDGDSLTNDVTADLNDDNGHFKIPTYMLELYNSEAGKSGQWNSVVRSYFDSGSSNRFEYHFNLSNIDTKHETLTKAELRIFKQNRYRSIDNRYRSNTLVQIDVKNLHDNKTVSSKLCVTHLNGWQTFPVTDIVRKWLRNTTENQGIRVSVEVLYGETESSNQIIEFASRDTIRREPILIVYTQQDNQQSTLSSLLVDSETESADRTINKKKSSPEEVKKTTDTPNKIIDLSDKISEVSDKTTELSNKNTKHLNKNIDVSDKKNGMSGKKNGGSGKKNGGSDKNTDTSDKKNSDRRRVRRQVIRGHISHDHDEFDCRVERLELNVKKLRWNMVVHPKFIRIDRCKGVCQYHEGQNRDSKDVTNHSILQSIYARNTRREEDRPCCAPIRFKDGKAISKDISQHPVGYRLVFLEKLRVTECGCL